MARIRTIKPKFWSNEELSALPEATHLLAAALLNYADDEGYFNANPKLVQAECSPLREPSVSTHDSLITLARIGYIKLGTGADSKRYGVLPTFSEHQRINRKTDSKIKTISIVWDDSLSPHTQLTEPSHPEGNGREEEGKGKEDAAASAAHSGSAEIELYKRGKEILGAKAGGLITDLVKAKQGSFALARAAIETASTKQNPREYVGAIIRGTGPPDDARARGDAW